MEASDREDELGDWLEDHEIPRGWDLAPTFVQAGLDVAWLDQVAATVPDGDPGRRAPLARLHGRDRAADERDRGLHHPDLHAWSARPSSTRSWTGRRTRMVDVHELLDSTLVMLGAQDRPAITVVREYDRDRADRSRPTRPS